MKRKIITILIFALSLSLFASEPVDVKIIDGIYNTSIKEKMETSMSKLLTEINAAQDQNRLPKYSALGLSTHVQGEVSMLWETCPFICSDSEVMEHCVTTNDGYQIRNIPLLMKPTDGTKLTDDEYQEAVINFDKSGNITSFRIGISSNLIGKIIRSNTELKDLRRRQLILDYVDQFRTSYNLKDMKFLQQVFSDDALIITGKVIKQATSDGIRLPDKIEYKKQSKAEYLSNLGRAFKSNKSISVKFDDIKVMLHPSNPDYYGVTIHQNWKSDRYHDEGYVFLLWDFKNEKEPKIHVRTWQPEMFNGKKLPEDKVFNIFDFEIE